MKICFSHRVLSLLFICLLPITINARGDREESITIAEQYGLAYAPLQIMAAKGFLEEEQPLIRVNWVKLGNTAAIREAVLAGDVDAAFMGIPPFLISRDKGMEWKIAFGLSRSPLGLVVGDEIHSFDDFTPGSRIALPQPGSIQHILLAMAMERIYSNPTRLDHSLVSLKHPDGMNALLSGSLEGHFTSPPYLFQEMDQPGFRQLLSGEEAMGEPFTFIAGVVTENFYKNKPHIYKSYRQALNRSVLFINENPDESLDILAPLYHMDRELLKEYLYERGMVFETEIHGLNRFIDFMSQEGLITQIKSDKEVMF
jgi:NitT/TauT family transport system substrate-binding protein